MNTCKGRRGGIATSKNTIINSTSTPMYKHDLNNAPHCIMESCNEWN